MIQWFYEEQGIRRFDAANRFFLVLIDLKNLEDSWKLKRNKKLLYAKINEFLDNNKNMDFEKLKIIFNWQDRTYTTYATILFIIKSRLLWVQRLRLTERIWLRVFGTSLKFPFGEL